MKTSEVNESLIGRRVKTYYNGTRYGVIVGIVEDKYCKGVRIKLDKPVFWASGYGVQHTEWWEHEYDSTARKFDDFGNLRYVELVN